MPIIFFFTGQVCTCKRPLRCCSLLFSVQNVQKGTLCTVHFLLAFSGTLPSYGQCHLTESGRQLTGLSTSDWQRLHHEVILSAPRHPLRKTDFLLLTRFPFSIQAEAYCSYSGQKVNDWFRPLNGRRLTSALPCLGLAFAQACSFRNVLVSSVSRITTSGVLSIYIPWCFEQKGFHVVVNFPPSLLLPLPPLEK